MNAFNYIFAYVMQEAADFVLFKFKLYIADSLTPHIVDAGFLIFHILITFGPYYYVQSLRGLMDKAPAF
eukprot:UN24267